MDYKQVAKRMNDEIDRLSNLPDDLIHKILSFSLQHLPFSPATIPGNPGRLVAGDHFPGRHVAREKLNGKGRMGYLPGRLSRATTPGPHILVKQLSATVEVFPGRHVARESIIN
nr:F-box domain, leucine-rich repeat domain, L domain-like protein [Tanacetum cinerariifolium]